MPLATCTSGYVGLTYDDGPNPATTDELLNALRSAGARATFFDIGSRVRQNLGLVQAVRNAGMWIGNHTWTHLHLTQLSTAQITDEINRTQQALRSATGQTPGNRVMRIRVEDARGGGSIPARRAVLRFFALVLAAIPLCAGILMILVDRRRRGLQDVLARTYVVHAFTGD